MRPNDAGRGMESIGRSNASASFRSLNACNINCVSVTGSGKCISSDGKELATGVGKTL